MMHRLFLSGTILAFVAVAYAEESPTTYGGRNTDAPWRAEAHAEIERIRKAPLKVQVVDAQGKPIRGAKVQVRQRRHAFGFGNILNPNTFHLEGEDGRAYREVFAKHFNKTTFESGFRWHNWYLPARQGKLDEHKKLLDRMIRFCRSENIAIRGHYLSWAPLSREYWFSCDFRDASNCHRFGTPHTLPFRMCTWLLHVPVRAFDNSKAGDLGYLNRVANLL